MRAGSDGAPGCPRDDERAAPGSDRLLGATPVDSRRAARTGKPTKGRPLASSTTEAGPAGQPDDINDGRAASMVTPIEFDKPPSAASRWLSSSRADPRWPQVGYRPAGYARVPPRSWTSAADLKGRSTRSLGVVVPLEDGRPRRAGRGLPRGLDVGVGELPGPAFEEPDAAAVARRARRTTADQGFTNRDRPCREPPRRPRSRPCLTRRSAS